MDTLGWGEDQGATCGDHVGGSIADYSDLCGDLAGLDPFSVPPADSGGAGAGSS